ncbi:MULTISPECIES: hypothetical protein [Ensifer]|jgi:hypothetical protein|uniref:hypothetical protein n=1 Tax=Ensifer TaxID=106591 RepID=UPI000714073A|nr:MULTISPECIES: hypothetical protein [Ensifer]KQX58254.1 hypothetical protein ASD49_19350 [Ensifer sp. Root1298]KQX84259.1 hypothetical protein ASD41_32395 [Ensifer sp. Root1312]KQZ50209.1 hypothetical protein ASD63_30140 [Ensifer sp. Root558]KRC22296.1 hypothetical protein ASE29_29360 [Ensifer sp. Root74]KRD77794.1 hypothetical protein ASE71_16730 [Ensifer sp. Root954]
MTLNEADPRRKYAVRYPDGLTSQEAIALLEQACADVAPDLRLSEMSGGATVEGEPWHVLSICLALPLFEMTEIP